MSWNRYIKYAIPHSTIDELLRTKRKIVFFIDMQSISKGLYKKDNIFFEIKHYVENREPSEILINEYRDFINGLYKRFKFFNPFFVTFYDDGKNIQNRLIDANYKNNRSAIREMLMDDEREIHNHVKKLYFAKIETRFDKPGIGKTYYLKEYESDLIPWYCIVNNLFDSQDPNTLNIILSSDKDLLQCCQFPNTYQCTNRFFSSREGSEKMDIKIFNDDNAISYIHDKYKLGGFITAKYIPIILSIAGDKADEIEGIKGIGIKKAIDLINSFQIPPTPWEIVQNLSKMPQIIKDNLKTIEKNFKMISFEEQLRRTKHPII